MRGRGFETYTEQILNAWNRIQLLNMERQEPIFLLQTDNYHNWVFTFHSTRVQLQLVGDYYCRIYNMHPLLPGGTGQNIYILGLGKVGSVLPTHLVTE